MNHAIDRIRIFAVATTLALSTLSAGFRSEAQSLLVDAPASNTFAAAGCNERVTLTWDAGQDTASLGFNVYREQSGKRVRLNPSLIGGPALRRGGVGQATYRYAWSDHKPHWQEARFWVEAVGLSGTSTWLGPVTAVPACDAALPANSPLLTVETSAEPAHAEPREARPATGVSPVTDALIEMPRTVALRTPGNQAQQWNIAAGAAVKIGVRRSGWYRVTQPQLIAAGLPPTVTPRFLHLFAEGNEVPITVSAQNRDQMTATDFIEFYGTGLDTPTTDTHVYWLTVGTSLGRRIPVAATAAPTATPLASFTDTVESKPRTIYFLPLRNGDADNFFGPVIASQPVTRTLMVYDPVVAPLAGGLPPYVVLNAALQGVSTAAHTVTVRINGVTLGTITFTGQIHQAARFPVPASALRAGANSVTFIASEAQADVTLLDAVSLSYARRLQAVNDALTLTAAAGQTVTVHGFSSSTVRVLDITNPVAVAEITPRVQTPGGTHRITLRVPGTGTRLLATFVDGQFMVPAAVTRNNPSTWHLSSQSADFVIIAHAAFTAAAATLAAHRRAGGLATAVVDVADLYDEFTYGAHDPAALKSFLARSRLWSRAPRFVALLGDSSFDPRNYLGHGTLDLVPTKLIDAATIETCSDDWFADFNNDGIAELAVGRLAVRTAAQAQAVVAKIAGYSGVAATNPPAGALLVSDTKRDYDFRAANELIARLLPPTLPVQRVNRDDGDAATVRTRLLAALNQGPLLVNFEGHGNIDIWTGARLLTNDDAKTLTNGRRLSLYLCSNCLNGYFQDPLVTSLGEALLTAPRGGAIAVWASSGETLPGEQQRLTDEFVRLMFQEQSDRPRTIGEAVVRAKSATPDLDVRRTWILFGDPTTPLAPGGAPIVTPPVDALERTGRDGTISDGNSSRNTLFWPFWPLRHLMQPEGTKPRQSPPPGPSGQSVSSGSG